VPAEGATTGGHYEDRPSFDAANGVPSGGTERMWVSDGPAMGSGEQNRRAATAIGKATIGTAEILASGVWNQTVRIAGGLASIPYLLDSVDAAVAVQEGMKDRFEWTPQSDGAKGIIKALQPVAAVVSEKIEKARAYSESKIGDGATTVLFSGTQAALEIAGTVTGTRSAAAFVERRLFKTAEQGAGRGAAAELADELSDAKAVGNALGENGTIATPGGTNLRAIAAGAAELSPAQAAVLAQLEGNGSRIVIPKRGFGQTDLAALSAATGDEFAMFTAGGRRLVVRGTADGIPIGIADGSAQELAAQGWRWSSHVHPDGVLRSSIGDRAVLDVFRNQRSAILDPVGGRSLFSPAGDMLSPSWLP
jgi:hypothetical protein